MQSDNYYKLYGLIHRRQDFSLDAFSSYWRDIHSLEALKLRKFFSAYVQNHGIGDDVSGVKNLCDGVPELWFESLEQIAAMTVSEEYQQGAYADEPRFMHGRAAGMVVQDKIIESRGESWQLPEAVRTLFFIKVKTDSSKMDSSQTLSNKIDSTNKDTEKQVREQLFQDWCVNSNAPAIELKSRPLRHVRSLPVAIDNEPPVYDAVESYWWPNLESATSAWHKVKANTALKGVIDLSACGQFTCRQQQIHVPADFFGDQGF